MKRSVDVINSVEDYLYRKERNKKSKENNFCNNYKMQEQRRDRIHKDRKEHKKYNNVHDDHFDRYDLPGQWEYMPTYQDDLKAYQNYQARYSSMKKIMSNNTHIIKNYEENLPEKPQIVYDDEEEEGEIKDEPEKNDLRDEKDEGSEKGNEEKTLDFDSEFMVLDSIESDSDSDVEEIVDSDEEINRNIGAEYCNLVYYCQLCSTYLLGHSDNEKALLIHCRSRKHFDNCKKAKKIEKTKKKTEDLNKLIKEHNQLRDEIRRKRK